MKGHNSKSSDSKVELLEFKYGEKVIPLDKLEQKGLWNIKDESLSSNDQLGKELVYYGDPQFEFATTDISFLFHISDQSGIIEIQVDGEKLSLDLYSQISGQTRSSFTMEKTSYE